MKTAFTLLCLYMLLPQQSVSRDYGIWYEERVYDFGCVGIDFNIYHDYQLVNHGRDTIKVDSVKVSCDCSSVSFLDSLVGPGDTVSFRLKFNTRDYYGKVSKSILIFTNDPKAPQMRVYYLATVGQWLHKVKPEPVSVFFLPGQKSKKATILNMALKSIEVKEIDPLDDLISIKLLKDKAFTNGRVALDVTPRQDLQPGTYYSNFRVTFELSGGYEPLMMTIPVKVVVY